MRRGREREIELISKLYDVDEEKKLVNIPLHFDKASDLVDDRIIHKNDYVIDNDLLAEMTTNLRRLPLGYTVNYDLHIDDYEDLDRKKIVESFNDSLELNNYHLAREKRKKFLLASIFLITGIVILFFVVTAKTNKIFDNINNGDIFSEVFDIFAWVFIWEFITILFMTPSELEVNSRVFRLKVRSISFYDKDSNLIEKVDTGTTYFDWEDERKMEKVLKFSLLVSGAAFIAIGFMDLIKEIFFIQDLVKISAGLIETNASVSSVFLLILLSILGYVSAFIEIFGGVVALSIYRGRKSRKITIFTRIFTVLLFFVIILEILNLVLSIKESKIFGLVLMLIISIVYFVAIVLLGVLNKRAKRQEKILELEEEGKIEEAEKMREEDAKKKALEIQKKENKETKKLEKEKKNK